MDDHKQEAAGRKVLSWWELWPILGWGVFTLYLFGTGKILYLLRPAYAWLALVAALVLLAAFLYGWILRRRALQEESDDKLRPTKACGECHDHSPAAGWVLYARSLVFAVPLAIGFFLPDQGLTSLAALEWTSGDLSKAVETAAAQEQEKAVWERDYAMTTVTGVALRLRQMQEDKVTAVGMVAHVPQLPAGQFLLVRFKMTCCAADATPVAVPVQWEKAGSLKEGGWVKVFGTTAPAARALAADEVEPTKEPASPYL
jgi:uncharacterized repeat protein (TIGR03943 family)